MLNSAMWICANILKFVHMQTVWFFYAESDFHFPPSEIPPNFSYNQGLQVKVRYITSTVWKSSKIKTRYSVSPNNKINPSNTDVRIKHERQINLRSSSKCVSVPSGPGIEHTSLAFRKVVHLFIRLLWPPISF